MINRRLFPYLLLLLIAVPVSLYAQSENTPLHEDAVLKALIPELDSLISENVLDTAVRKENYYIDQLLATEEVISNGSSPRMDEIAAEQQKFKNDYGLSVNWSYLNNIEQGIFTAGEIFYNKRLTTGLKWDILQNGLLTNKNRAEELEVEKKLARDEFLQSSATDKYKALDKKIRYFFNRGKAEFVREYLDVVSVNLKIMHRLHYMDLEPWEEVLDLSSLKARLEHKLNTYHTVEERYGEVAGEEKFGNISKMLLDLSVPDIDMELFLESVREHHNNIQLGDDTLDNLDYSLLSDISVSVSAQYNIYDSIIDRPENEAVGGREYFSTSLNISFPLPINRGSKKKLAEARKRRIVKEQKDERINRQDEITDLFVEYRQQQQRYIERYKEFLVHEEEIKRQRALRKLENSQFSVRRLSNTLIDRYAAVLELLDIKQQLFLKLITLDAYIPTESIDQFIRESDLENIASKGQMGAEYLYIWSADFAATDNQRLVKYLQENGFKHLFLSVGPDTSLYQKAKAFNHLASEKGITSEMLIGNNQLINYESRNDEFRELAVRAEKLQFNGIHLDVEPHTFDDWDSNREKYLRNYVNMLKSVRSAFNDTSLEISVSVPHFYDPIISDLDQLADLIVVMTYETTDMDSFLNRIDAERAALNDRFGIALRPEDFDSQYHLKKFVTQVGSQTDLQAFVLHDYSAIKELKVR